jgi:hypothetical protein
LRTAAALGLAALALLLLAEPGFAQCPMCRTALASPEAQGLAAAFRRGILFLLTVPFGAVGIIAGLIIRERRRSGLESDDFDDGGPT